MQRQTQQRDSIRKVFADHEHPLSPRDVLEKAREHKPGLGIATVYRALKELVDEGSVVPVEVPGSPPHYESAGKHHHHHFHCRSCGRVYEVEGCPGGIRRLTPPGFFLESHELVLRGVCLDCSA